jgi:hypothetical protein
MNSNAEQARQRHVGNESKVKSSSHQAPHASWGECGAACLRQRSVRQSAPPARAGGVRSGGWWQRHPSCTHAASEPRSRAHWRRAPSCTCANANKIEPRRACVCVARCARVTHPPHRAAAAAASASTRPPPPAAAPRLGGGGCSALRANAPSGACRHAPWRACVYQMPPSAPIAQCPPGGSSAKDATQSGASTPPSPNTAAGRAASGCCGGCGGCGGGARCAAVAAAERARAASDSARARKTRSSSSSLCSCSTWWAQTQGEMPRQQERLSL